MFSVLQRNVLKRLLLFLTVAVWVGDMGSIGDGRGVMGGIGNGRGVYLAGLFLVFSAHVHHLFLFFKY